VYYTGKQFNETKTLTVNSFLFIIIPVLKNVKFVAGTDTMFHTCTLFSVIAHIFSNALTAVCMQRTFLTFKENSDLAVN
jgi:hypothetical protein